MYAVYSDTPVYIYVLQLYTCTCTFELFFYLSFIRLEYAGDNFVRHTGDAREFAKSQSMYM